MKHLRAILLSLTATALLLHSAQAGEAGKRLKVHFFTSPLCPHCKHAEKDLPAMLQRYPQITLATYEVLNARGRIDAANLRNRGIMIALLRDINARLGGRPFIYESGRPHAFALVNGTPYYLVKISASTTVKKDIPIPLFIMGDRAYIGYRRQEIERAIARYSGNSR